MQLGFLSGLSGEVPGSLGRIGQLGYLDVSGNMLTGTLPALASSQLITLRLAENFLSGTIPASYGGRCLHHLDCVHISTQSIGACPWCADPMPSTHEVCAIEAKISCSLRTRAAQLREGPCAGSMSNLVSMELEGNQLEGTLPAGVLPAHAAALHVLKHVHDV